MKRLITVFAIVFVAFQLQAQDVTKPIPLNLDEIADMIEYPQQAKVECIEGNVFIEFTVSNIGEVTSFSVKEICDPIFEKSVEKAVKNLIFVPAMTQEGNTVESKITIPFKFRVELI